MRVSAPPSSTSPPTPSAGLIDGDQNGRSIVRRPSARSRRTEDPRPVPAPHRCRAPAHRSHPVPEEPGPAPMTGHKPNRKPPRRRSRTPSASLLTLRQRSTRRRVHSSWSRRREGRLTDNALSALRAPRASADGHRRATPCWRTSSSGTVSGIITPSVRAMRSETSRSTMDRGASSA